MAKATRPRKKNPHDFKYAKKTVLKEYAAKRGLRKGSKQYNAYVNGPVARAIAAKKRRSK